MEREQLDRLLAEYATGGLSEADKQKLFAAALHDQDLFDQLMEEDSLREAIEMPGARNRLIDSLQEDAVEAMAAMAPASGGLARAKSAPARPRQPLWLAWASGVAIVLVSGAISYVAFDRPLPKQIASVFTPRPAPKEFVPPPASPAVSKPRVATVDPPPAIATGAGPAAAAPPPVNIPLPTAPPPPAPRAEAEAAVPPKENKVADAVLSARVERDQVQTEFRAAPSQQQAPGAAAPSAKPISAPPPARSSVAESVTVSAGAAAIGTVSKAEASREDRAKVAQTPPSLWRLAADGVWVRVPAGDKAPRAATLVIRYIPTSSANVTVTDSNGRRLVQRQGRPGVELDLPLPPPSAAELTLTITEGPRATPFKILFE